MTDTTNAPESDPKAWTLMFYFASDNSLASTIVSQLKALKDAGFHQQANVIAYFDPQPKNIPSHVFDVNLVEKLKKPHPPRHVFAGNDPFTRNLVFDRLWTKKDKETRDTLRQYFEEKYKNQTPPFKYSPKQVPDTLVGEQSPRESLANFLEFCRLNYPARRYMLFILGHGVVVGNDIFLLDENIPDDDDDDDKKDNKKDTKPAAKTPVDQAMVKKPARHSLKLKALGEELETFKKNIGADSRFELLGLHSCSMSGLEVAYEVQGTANYLLASQGPAFVGSWPYKQILTRIFNDLEDLAEDDSPPKLEERLIRIFNYCIQNGYDFWLAGYSFDMALCDLNNLTDGPQGATAAIKELSQALIAGLKEEDEALKKQIKDLILLAHWEAQSFWQEQYTDLYDFCYRLKSRIPEKPEPPAKLKRIRAACQDMMKTLKRGKRGEDNGLIVRSGFIGPAFQYSHGLSVFFPWSEPVDKKFMDRYAKYKFTLKFEKDKDSAWLDFLNTYFVETRRPLHADEPKDETDDPGTLAPTLVMQDSLLSALQSIADSISGSTGQLGKGPGDPTGDDCECPSIKNYPSSTNTIKKDYQTPLGPDLAEQFASKAPQEQE
ncbi:MAG TPA: clostripain-related cysteine peptidase [Blastocatellia bacterium]|nr:clostripain-related cysteine peptidase [Blastocatellia bacterium]